MNEYTKLDRHQLIKNLINGQEISDQQQLLEELKKQGCDATQATVSRDLQELNVTKVRVRSGSYKYEIFEKTDNGAIENKLKVLFDNFVIDMKATGNLILIKCTPGNANGVASFIDRLGRREILGTVAGDDTILVVIDTAENSREVQQEFQKLLGSRNSDNR